MIQVDRHTVIQILGSLMAQPSLLNDTDKYLLEKDDFPQTMDKYIFSAIYNLYTQGAKAIRTVDIVNYLDTNSKAKNLIEKENGISFLQDCENECEPKNFSYYYNNLKKLNLLKDLQRTGKDVSNIYCEDVLSPDYNKINDKFETMTPNDIINLLKSEVANYEKKFVLNNQLSESRASDNIRDLIKELKEEPEVGCPLQGDIFNTICRGGRKGKMYLRSAGTSVGKAIPNYTKIPTPNGWTTVGEIKVGDYLFDRHGKPTKVLAVYPQKEKKQVYKVYFKSGRIAECCNEHLWSYYSNLNDKTPNKLITSTLQEIIDNPKGLQNKDGGYRWSIPICEPVQYEEKKYSIDPYVMGLILGDGSFRYNKRNKAFTFSSADIELVESIKERMRYKKYKKNNGKNYSWTFESDYENHSNVWVEDILKDYPELWQVKSENKFIPQDYLFGSIKQRFDLLSGLLDTDGHISKNGGRTSFTTVSLALRDNIIELCESLGMTCSYLVDKRTEKYTTGECYQIKIKAKPEVKRYMFKLKRKREIVEKYLNNNKRKERRDRDAIVKIEATSIYTDMTCFYVDNEEHLFLANNFLVTHNTRQMVGDCCCIAYPIRYDISKNEWISTGNCEKVLYVMTEQDPEEIKTMILAYLTGYNEEIFLYGNYTEEHMERINVAISIMEKYKDNVLFARIPDPSSSVIKNLFRRYNLQYGVENFFYDYIFSSPAMLEEYRDLKLPEHVCLRLFTTALKNLAVELNSFIMTSTQISGDDDPKGGFRDYKKVRGSRAIADLVDVGCIMSRPTREELQPYSEYISTFGEPNLVIDVYKNRRGRWNMVRIFCKNDLGICRRKDLFITDAQGRILTDFNLANYSVLKNGGFNDELNLYNTGEVRDSLLESSCAIEPKETENLTADDIKEAFGTLAKNKDWDDML